jgi:diguanylate cyclase (GGDEF)-like protein
MQGPTLPVPRRTSVRFNSRTAAVVGSCVLLAFACEPSISRAAPATAVESGKAVAQPGRFAETFAAAIAGTAGRQHVLSLRAFVESSARRSRAAADTWRKVADLAARRGDESARLYALYASNDALIQISAYERLRVQATELVEAARAADAPGWAAWGEGSLGVVARRRGELELALRHQQAALAATRRAGNDRTRALVLINLGTVYRDLGRYAEALDMQLQALDIRRARADHERVDVPYRNIGLLYRDIEEYDTAREYFQRAIDAAGHEGDPTALSSALGSLATLLNDRGEYDAALDAARRALAIDAPLDVPYPIALEHLEIARAQLGLGRNDEALEHIRIVLDLGRRLRQPDVTGTGALLLGMYEAATGDGRAAEAALLRAVDELSRGGLRHKLLAAYAALEPLLEARGALAEALELARRRAQLREELLGVAASRRIALQEFEYERTQAERLAELLRKDNELAQLKLETEALRRRVGLGAIAALLALAGLLAWRWREASRTAAALGAKNAEISSQQQALRSANLRLEAQTEELYEAAIRDPLTGIWNRGHLMSELSRHFDATREQSIPLALLLLDLDNFKPLNDTWGHQFGDRVLIELARFLRETLRAGELIGRYGGEEFLIGLPGQTLEAAHMVAERLRQGVERHFESLDGHRIDLTASIGIASVDLEQPGTLVELIARADGALYRAKHDGRNRTREALSR